MHNACINAPQRRTDHVTGPKTALNKPRKHERDEGERGGTTQRNIFLNLIISTRNQIVFTIFRLIWNRTDDPLVPNQSKMVNIICFLVDLIRFRKDFFMCEKQHITTHFRSGKTTAIRFIAAPLLEIPRTSQHSIVLRGLMVPLHLSSNLPRDASLSDSQCENFQSGREIQSRIVEKFRRILVWEFYSNQTKDWRLSASCGGVGPS